MWNLCRYSYSNVRLWIKPSLAKRCWSVDVWWRNKILKAPVGANKEMSILNRSWIYVYYFAIVATEVLIEYTPKLDEWGIWVLLMIQDVCACSSSDRTNWDRHKMYRLNHQNPKLAILYIEEGGWCTDGGGGCSGMFVMANSNQSITNPPPISLATAWIDITICHMMCAIGEGGGGGGGGRSGKVQSQNQSP